MCSGISSQVLLSCLNSQLSNNLCTYDIETKKLQSEILNLQFQLKSINLKYDELCKSSSKTNNSETILNNTRDDSNCKLFNADMLNNLNISKPSQTCLNKHKTSILIYSDKIGQGLGSLLQYDLPNHRVSNICLPGASYRYLIDSLSSPDLDKNSTIVVYYGDSLSVKKKDLVYSINRLLDLNSKYGCKFILCALPYASNVTNEQNRHIYDLNLLIYNLTHRHSDIIFYFDLNKFINSKFRLNKDTMYLPFKLRRRIATLLAFNIHRHDKVMYDITEKNDIKFYNNNNVININCSTGPSTLNW